MFDVNSIAIVIGTCALLASFPGESEAGGHGSRRGCRSSCGASYGCRSAGGYRSQYGCNGACPYTTGGYAYHAGGYGAYNTRTTCGCARPYRRTCWPLGFGGPADPAIGYYSSYRSERGFYGGY